MQRTVLPLQMLLCSMGWVYLELPCYLSCKFMARILEVLARIMNIDLLT